METHYRGTIHILKNRISSSTISRLGQGSRTNSALPLAKLIRNKSPRARIPYRLERCCSPIAIYHGLSSEIKDALVHFDNPSSVSAAMDMAIRIDNRLFERRQEQQLSHQRPFSSNSPAAPITSRFMNQQHNKDSLIQDKLQIQSDPTPSSTYLLLGQLQIKR
ncbi:hypothetical protein BASA83_008155 [Batrachochytrium salamandrivorans]|nr:hypothetical protein BASA83_008155 [Batrachochytrium salamandrivorans]